jgi:hypothetical protein
MKKQDIISMMCTLFRNLSQSAQVEVMTMFYYDMYDRQKDQFLRETDNA